jgi:hypothetical protein
MKNPGAAEKLIRIKYRAKMRGTLATGWAYNNPP